ncbi:MAG: SDR family NAD(P)-dependent oxidoreductase, partial [Alkalibacterium sp.]|uniref:SDR family NAD(P)-dependent oxidoreductase n=1 Tax=Alkalibacterium sp. TaxID=1872447 RepID=UPI003971130A
MSIFTSDVFTGKHALITGATGGIGYETAKVLAAMGAAVTITGRKETVLNQLKEAIESERPNAKVMLVVADLANASDR